MQQGVSIEKLLNDPLVVSLWNLLNTEIEVPATKRTKQPPKKEDGVDGLTEWWLFHLAGAYTRAKRMEKYRSDFHTALYDNILCSSVTYGYEPRGTSPATDVQAIKIVEAKERYERTIRREYERFNLYRRILSEYVENDRERAILDRYFRKRKKVDKEIVHAILKRLRKDLDNLDREVGEERTKESTKIYRKYYL